MLIWVEGNAASAGADMADAVSREAIINIAAAVRAGLHVLGGARSYLRALVASGALGPEVCAAIESSEQQLSQDGSLLADVSKIRVSTAFDEPVRSDQDWLVPMNYFARAELCERAKLLVENLTDFAVYRALAIKMIEERFSSMTLSLQPLNGGGDTTADVLLNESRVGFARLLCIVDSDREHPSDKPKQTASKCNAVFSDIENKWMYELVVLGCRELENLIPENMRIAACSGLAPEQKACLVSLSGMPEEALAHICLKKGDRLCRFYMDGTLPCVAAHNATTCVYCGLERGCPSTPVLGDRFLRRLVEAVEGGDLAVCGEKEWTGELKSVVSKVLATGLSRPVSRAA